MMPIVSSDELVKINEAIKRGFREIETSLDLGMSKIKVKLGKEGFYVEDQLVKIGKIKDDEKSCYLINNGKLEKAQYFSDKTNSVYKLIPTSDKPILKISGTSMHKMEFVERIRKDKLRGKILDSGTGLGYTAISSAKTADEVITIEKDENVIEMAKLNPYSRELFENKRIIQRIGDLTEEILEFDDEEFRYAILDGGIVSSSGNFFSLENYKEVIRVLKRNGALYHYLPRPQTKHGRNFISEVGARLKKAGFSAIYKNEKDCYIIARK